jgi:CubicO group peptidase (beta-lactamase class C family)
LTHTSGLIREAQGFDPLKVQSDAAVLRSAYSQPLRFEPGEKYEYSNTGYFALAEVIHKVSGRPWPEYLDEKVFKPSGMNSTFPTNTTRPIPNLAQGYVDNDKLQEADTWVALRPSGAFLSTVLELAKWDAMLNTEKILSETTRRQMWSPMKLNSGASSSYGFGWEISDRNRRLVFHTGGMPGFRAGFLRYLDDRVTVIVLMNLDDVDISSIVYGVANIHLPDR